MSCSTNVIHPASEDICSFHHFFYINLSVFQYIPWLCWCNCTDLYFIQIQLGSLFISCFPLWLIMINKNCRVGGLLKRGMPEGVSTVSPHYNTQMDLIHKINCTIVESFKSMNMSYQNSCLNCLCLSLLNSQIIFSKKIQSDWER